MDTQIATNPRGFLHAVNRVRNDQDARRFLSVMEHQGFVVEHLSQVAAVARFARPTRLTNAPERPTQAPLPELGTRIQFKVEQQSHIGTVAAVLRWPADHPHCLGRVALLVRASGWEGLVEPHTAVPAVEVQQPAPPVEHFHPLSVQRSVEYQPGLW